MFPIKRLHDLQEIDLDIDARDKALADVRSRLADDSAVTAARDKVAELDLKLQAPSTRRRDLELAVQQMTDRLRLAEERLYSGSITSPRELTAYEADREHLQKQRGAEEDKLLEVMVEVDEVRSSRERAARSLERTEAERQADVVELEKNEQELGGELKKLRQSRDGVTPDIPPSAMSVYEGLRKTRDGVAVSRVVRLMCQQCRLTLPTMELQRARAAQTIVQCSSCQRILCPV